MSLDVEKTIRAYLPDIIHLSLATCVGDRPWVCEVHFAYDDDLNLYFRSLASTRHCQELAANPQVAGDIVTQHGPTDKPRGLYFEGKAARLTTDAGRAQALKYFERLGVSETALEEAKDPAGHQFYQITVSNWYVFDSRESKPSQKYHLSR